MSEEQMDLIVSLEQIKTLLTVYKKYGHLILKNRVFHHVHNGHVVLDIPYFNSLENEIWKVSISKSGGYTEKRFDELNDRFWSD